MQKERGVKRKCGNPPRNNNRTVGDELTDLRKTLHPGLRGEIADSLEGGKGEFS